jgi:uncharacterized protein (DUF433 family)
LISAGKKRRENQWITFVKFRRGKSALAVVVIQSYGLIMLDWSKCAAVERIVGKVSGAWRFKGTRVPVAALFENLEDGATVDDFLEWFPGVARDQVEAVLEHAGQSLAVA